MLWRRLRTSLTVYASRWLEQTYPDAPSLFLPASKPPVSLDSPEMSVARSYAQLFNAGKSSA